MTYFATFILYPVLFALFGFASTPYILKSKAERDIARFGEHGESWTVFVYFSLTFCTAWIQFAFNKDLNRYLQGDPYLCDPFTEDCSALYQAEREAAAAKAAAAAAAETEANNNEGESTGDATTESIADETGTESGPDDNLNSSVFAVTF